MKTTIAFDVDTENLPHITDEYLAQLWHVSQANTAPYGDRTACEFAEHVAREIVRRWVSAQPPALWHHQGRHIEIRQREDNHG